LVMRRHPSPAARSLRRHLLQPSAGGRGQSALVCTANQPPSPSACPAGEGRP
jgi:hypothetical protein